MAALEEARAAEGDSLRAAVGLHADLAIALTATGQLDAAAVEVDRALTLAERGGSARQRKRLRRIRSQSAGH